VRAARPVQRSVLADVPDPLTSARTALDLLALALEAQLTRPDEQHLGPWSAGARPNVSSPVIRSYLCLGLIRAWVLRLIGYAGCSGALDANNVLSVQRDGRVSEFLSRELRRNGPSVTIADV
jgi:hypothetical protein